MERLPLAATAGLSRLSGRVAAWLVIGDAIGASVVTGVWGIQLTGLVRIYPMCFKPDWGGAGCSKPGSHPHRLRRLWHSVPVLSTYLQIGGIYGPMVDPA